MVINCYMWENNIFRVTIRYDRISFLLTGKGLEIFTWAPIIIKLHYYIIRSEPKKENEKPLK